MADIELHEDAVTGLKWYDLWRQVRLPDGSVMRWNAGVTFWPLGGPKGPWRLVFPETDNG